MTDKNRELLISAKTSSKLVVNGKNEDLNFQNVKASTNLYDWELIYPELKILKDNSHEILEEVKKIPKWVPWPEELSYGLDTNASSSNNAGEWTVFPFLHTFPATDINKMSWIDSTCAHCPFTVNLLKQIPNVRTALFSRLSPNTSLKFHTGWKDLANHVLRCHICLYIPEEDKCGLEVGNSIDYRETRLYSQDDIIVFDDSKLHRAFNTSKEDRIVLIVDIMRPSDIPLGTATGGHTKQLDDFIELFR